MCEAQYTKTKQELEAIKVAKNVIAKVFQTYANPTSPAQKPAVTSTIDELIASVLQRLLKKYPMAICHMIWQFIR